MCLYFSGLYFTFLSCSHFVTCRKAALCDGMSWCVWALAAPHVLSKMVCICHMESESTGCSLLFTVNHLKDAGTIPHSIYPLLLYLFFFVTGFDGNAEWISVKMRPSRQKNLHIKLT